VPFGAGLQRDACWYSAQLPRCDATAAGARGDEATNRCAHGEIRPEPSWPPRQGVETDEEGSVVRKEGTNERENPPAVSGVNSASIDLRARRSPAA
jgi:hypothetical protein